MKTYKVQHIGSENFQCNNLNTDDVWSKASELTDFTSPWDNAPVKKITFKALWTDSHLHFKFHVADNQIHICKTNSTICTETIGESDRVELFFRTNKQLNPYYCLEIDPSSRVMDFKAKPNKEFDFDWQWPTDEIRVKSEITATDFTVEITLSIASLKKLDLIQNNCIETGIYRAKYNEQTNGSFEPTWISWVHPQTASPNFHISSSFGKLELVK